ncbi:MAG: chromosome partitioning protein ParA [Rhodobacteraceae bacterium]|jgi:cellulose biosynthesis protein BcsQ|uniref:ATPase involved in chromosome partitioning n=1 Tax=Salipiger profundus TaxID=1229727 RepID=A0A1U7D8N6_9RHOB|nr:MULTISPECIES: AAA family ATPase [Salipiger]APX24425.1 ATPase involved in chromosome partitioning [Salipiger profundus]MAB07272.1 chromosome partitioning protein ParA [Paracoccaceae bacterium]GGA19895.1 chromosome partitioning protein ParA [Salipiger profundus]SFD38534.1 Cellulose biosynthesis protein BcsQ [Salipiger profundus]
MFTHEDLAQLQTQSLKMQGWIRQQTFSPQMEKTLRRFSSWEVAELILKVNQSTLRGRMAADPTLPQGLVEEDGRQRWYSLTEINEIRRRLKVNRKSLMPKRPAGKRAFRVAISNFKGGAGKSTVALHFAHAAALDGYRVLCIDFDPQATLSHSMGLSDVSEEYTVWGIMARDLIRETERMNAAVRGAETGSALPERKLPESITGMGLSDLRVVDFIKPTCWPTIDVIPSCANAAFVEFASAQYRHLNPEWSFFAAVSRYLDALPADAYDMVIFDCPPAIGYQSMNAVFASDMLYIPSGPGYWEYDSTTSFIGQLSEALADLSGFEGIVPEGTLGLPKVFHDVRFLLTRYESGNELHRAMRTAFEKVWGDRVTENPIEMTRAVEQSGRFLSSIYEIDYREMTRETWRRARASFDRAYEEFRDHAIAAWDTLEDEA